MTPQVGDIIIFNNLKMLLVEADEEEKKFSWVYDRTPFRKGTAIVLEDSIRFVSIKLTNRETAIYCKKFVEHKKWRQTLLRNESFLKFQKKYLKRIDWCIY